jgi:hypothetical protein
MIIDPETGSGKLAVLITGSQPVFSESCPFRSDDGRPGSDWCVRFGVHSQSVEQRPTLKEGIGKEGIGVPEMPWLNFSFSLPNGPTVLKSTARKIKKP